MDTRKDKWNISKISNSCYKSNDLFDDNETVISELVYESLSSWKTTFKLQKPKEEIIKKDSIEDLLRKKISLESDDSINIIFILAIMLERKKVLIEKSFFFDDDNKKIRIYEHKKTNESFAIIDPQLSLNEIEPLKEEVYDLIKLTQNN
jgi:hypothetical protein